jgi:uncharacterized membrane protein
LQEELERIAVIAFAVAVALLILITERLETVAASRWKRRRKIKIRGGSGGRCGGDET